MAVNSTRSLNASLISGEVDGSVARDALINWDGPGAMGADDTRADRARLHPGYYGARMNPFAVPDPAAPLPATW